MSDNPGRKTPAKKTAAKKATAKKAVAKKAAAKKTTAKKAAATATNEATTTRRVIAARAPQRSEPQRGSLRDRLRTAEVTGAGSGDAERVALSRAPTADTKAAAGPRLGSVATPTGSRAANLVRNLSSASRVFTGPSGSPSGRPTGAADTSFAQVIARKDTDAIVAETLKRLETARISDVDKGLRAAEAELAQLRKERERLDKAADADKLTLIDGYIQIAEAEAESGKTILKLVEKARAQKGVITVIGRVSDASGKPPANAEVYFVDASGKSVEELAPVKPDDDGVVWIGLSAAQAEALVKRGGQISARARVAGKDVAADPFTARVKTGSVYQFDLRIRTGASGGSIGRSPGSPGRIITR